MRFTKSIPSLFSNIKTKLTVFSFVLALIVQCGVATPAKAQTGAEVAAGAAVAGVVIKVIGGLSSWVNDQSDDCAVAGLGAAWGNDCNLEQEECSETGWANAYCSAKADNACAYGRGSGRAYESLVGSWGGCTVSPYAFTYTKGLHGCKDKHYGKAWGKASVDGSSRASTRSTPTGKPGQNEAGPLDPAWPDGTVLAVISVDTVEVVIPKLNKSENSWDFFVDIDGSRIFSANASINGRGVPSIAGDIPASDFSVNYDPTTKSYTMAMYGFSTEIPIAYLDMPAPGLGDRGATAAADTNTEIEISVHAESEVSADSDADQDAVCTGGDVVVIDDYDTIDGFDSFGDLNETGEGSFEEGYRQMVRDIAAGLNTRTMLLGLSYPNPAKLNASIPFAVGATQDITLEIYDVTGRKVMTLAEASFEPGQYNINWNGQNSAGQRVSPGVYYYVLQSRSDRQSKKIVLTNN